ncbi:biotin transporter BioY [Xanthobacter autotrophicus DSM 431]|uniref:biotin transporter BioY n=1 Tax=Xanthobacter nonsaccharivorans TaxID=3119912 RepID=UPI003726B001
MPTAPTFKPAFARLASYAPMWALALPVAGVALLAWSAQVSIPLEPVPITLQSYVLLTMAALMGWRFTALTVAAYIAVGLMGLGVFSGLSGGLAVMKTPKAGFIVGFFVSAVLVAVLQERWARLRPLPLFGVLALGHLVLMTMGAGWIATMAGPARAFETAFLPYVPGAVVKTVAALATVILVERLAGTGRPR